MNKLIEKNFQPDNEKNMALNKKIVQIAGI